MFYSSINLEKSITFFLFNLKLIFLVNIDVLTIVYLLKDI